MYKQIYLLAHEYQAPTQIGTQVQIDIRTQKTAIENKRALPHLSMILNQLWPVLERLYFSSMMLQAKQACVFSTLVLSDIYTLYYLTPAAVRCR